MTVENISIDVKTNAGSAANQFRSLSSALSGVQGASQKTTSSFKNVGNSAKRSAKSTNEFASSLMRIAKYRLMRTIIKEITQGFNEGLKNAYHFSKGLNGSLAASLDTLATKSLTMKNQMGAAFGALLEAVMPIILQIISLIRELMQALSALFAAIGGGQYLVAKDTATAWDKATGAAKKYKNTILGFDEINRLDDKSGGGGGSASNWADMFDEGVLPPWAQKIKDFFDSDLASKLKLNFNDILFNWGKKLTGKQIAKKVITGLSALCGATVGFVIGGVPGAIVGTLIGAGLGVLFSSFIFDNDGTMSKNEVLKLVCVAAGALAGGALGFVVGGVPGAAIGVLVGAGLGVALSSMAFKGNGSQKSEALQTLVLAMSTLAGGAIGFAVGGPLGAVIGAVAGVGISLLINNTNFQNHGALKGTLMQSLAVVLGAISGGIIGFAVGGPLGAALGATIGVGISLAVGSGVFSANGKVDNNMLQSLTIALGALTGGLIGFMVGGPLGAAIGVVIGAGLTIAINNVAWDTKGTTIDPISGLSNFNEKFELETEYVPKVNNEYSGLTLKETKNLAKSKIANLYDGEFANGGWPDTGELFISREAGPELVGTINGNTAVATNDDIVAAVSSGVANAVGAVMGSNDGKTEVHVYLDSREIKYGQSRLARAMGV